MSTVNLNHGSSISSPQQFSPIKAISQALGSTDIGDKIVEKVQASLPSIFSEINNIMQTSDSGSVNSDSSGSSGIFSFLNKAIGMINKVTDISKSNNSSSNPISGENYQNGDWLNSLANSSVSSYSMMREFISKASGNTSNDPFSIFIRKIAKIFSNVDSYLSSRFPNNKEEMLNKLELRNTIQQINDLRNEYYSINNDNSSDLISSMANSVTNAIYNKSSEIAKREEEKDKIKKYNEEVKIAREKYAEKIQRDQVNKLKENPTSSKTMKSNNDYNSLVNMLRNSM